jgi:3-hydroxymyristoyl/3-hydroxydecanoyl-(acyl carrier protein) dehydratase
VASHSGELCIAIDEPAADGHFPGNPIVPGAVLLREVIAVVSGDGGVVCCGIRSAKFMHPVRPGDRLVVVWEDKANGEIGFTCSIGSPERRVLVGTLSTRER